MWEYPELPNHLYDFSPNTTRKLLGRAGLETFTVRTGAVPFDFYRTTTLPDQLAGRGLRGRLLGLVFEALRAGVYPAARVLRRGNYLFVAARRSGAN